MAERPCTVRPSLRHGNSRTPLHPKLLRTPAAPRCAPLPPLRPAAPLLPPAPLLLRTPAASFAPPLHPCSLVYPLTLHTPLAHPPLTSLGAGISYSAHAPLFHCYLGTLTPCYPISLTIHTLPPFQWKQKRGWSIHVGQPLLGYSRRSTWRLASHVGLRWRLASHVGYGEKVPGI